jgi:hypothetical protein
MLLSTAESSADGVAESYAAGADVAISKDARELAELTGIMPLYQRLRNEQQSASQTLARDPIQEMSRNQRIINLHARIMQCLQTVDCELRRVNAQIDSDSADVNDLRAVLAEERASVQHKTSLINLASGGATRIGAYSTAIATDNPLPVAIPEIVDGMVQMALSGLMVRQERKEKRARKLIPETITSFLSWHEKTPKVFPQVVWDFLNHPVPGRTDGMSRRQLVIQAWVGMHRVVETTVDDGTSGHKVKIEKPNEASIDITIAMMSDIKAALSTMAASLAELSEEMRNSYTSDPESLR